jgi:hypothetical protein
VARGQSLEETSYSKGNLTTVPGTVAYQRTVHYTCYQKGTPDTARRFSERLDRRRTCDIRPETPDFAFLYYVRRSSFLAFEWVPSPVQDI